MEISNNLSMDYTTIVNDTLSFGRYPYPPKEAAKTLEEHGHTVFIDLVSKSELWLVKKYHGTPPDIQLNYSKYLAPTSSYYCFPIIDRGIPDCSRDFRMFINSITSKHPMDKIFINCRCGHGRAGMVAAIILLEREKITRQVALNIVHKAHSLRTKISPKMLKIGAPQTLKQKKYVLDW